MQLGRRHRVGAGLGLTLLLGACGNNGGDPLARVPSPAVGAPATASAPVSEAAAPQLAPAASSAADPAERPELAEFYTQPLDWSDCASTFECASVRVPVDYTDPGAETLELAVTRLRASGSGSDRIGSLLTNPGGPGASGVEYLQAASGSIGANVRARYDLIGFDPRGIGGSEPIDCLSDRQLDEVIESDATVDDDEDFQILDRLARGFAAGCQKRSGDLLAHLGTDDVARDVDVLRAVLGDNRLYYLGFSYGTFIGARYAELFPARVGRLVLDGAIDPSLSGEELTLAQAAGFQTAWRAFVDDCLSGSGCALGRSRGEATTRVAALFAAAEAAPLRTRSGRELTESQATLGVLSALYSQARWDFLTQSLVAAFNGDGSGLLFLADAYLQREEDGSYRDNSNEAIYAVNCLDRASDSSPAGIRGQLASMREASPLFGEYIAWGNLPCHYWPVPALGAGGPVRAAGADPILVIGTTRDPATPYEWAVALAEQLESGVLLTHVGDGHTVYGDGKACIDDAVENYLLRGKPPKDGVRC
ncbi:MAG: alpha/beta hydrolase [Sporichthyaceae bacterium]